MKRIAVVFALVLAFSGALICWNSTTANAQNCPSGQYFRSGACADANGNKAGAAKLPPGYVLFPDAQGKNVPIKHATTYAQCARNGRVLGYAEAQIETYCHEHYAH